MLLTQVSGQQPRDTPVLLAPELCLGLFIHVSCDVQVAGAVDLHLRVRGGGGGGGQNE